jgi:hypothetical protein
MKKKKSEGKRRRLSIKKQAVKTQTRLREGGPGGDNPRGGSPPPPRKPPGNGDHPRGGPPRKRPKR